MQNDPPESFPGGLPIFPALQSVNIDCLIWVKGICKEAFYPNFPTLELRQHRTMGAAGFGGSFAESPCPILRRCLRSIHA